ncbi:MAG: SCO family protein, partial [Alphaproteobacteria bacterium]|nr:SCO family protein [Alphaproteobacteria bacterium]
SGRTVRFYSDILKGKIVLVSLFFTECEGMCPTINASLAEVQEQLDDRMGRDIVLISITLDPETDTTEVLREYAANFDTGKGWYFLTGKSAEIKTVTRKLGHVASTPDEHTGVLILGNVATATWTKIAPSTPPGAIVEKLKLLAEGGLAQQ